MRVSLSDRERRFIGVFEEETDATARDCIVVDDDGETRVVFLVAAGEMGTAIGPGGQRVSALESRLGKSVHLVEDADTPEAFVAAALAPATVRHVTISEQNDRVAYAEVPDDERGAAIGRDGRNIDVARRLAARHHDIDDIELT
jgi:N utilization substance protein A